MQPDSTSISITTAANELSYTKESLTCSHFKASLPHKHAHFTRGAFSPSHAYHNKTACPSDSSAISEQSGSLQSHQIVWKPVSYNPQEREKNHQPSMESDKPTTNSGWIVGKEGHPTKAGRSSEPPANSNNKEESVSTTTHLFRPIKFESTPATPESNGSEGGSETTIDSAYGSETVQATAGRSNHGEGEGVEGTSSTEEANLPHFSGTITAALLDEDLWKSFNRIGNEMIVTKPGR